MLKNKLYVGEQVFTSQYGSCTISRLDYEDLMIPMIAEELSDEQMQKLVDNINLSMRSEYDDDELALLTLYRDGGNEDTAKMTQEQINLADRMSEREFEFFERCAREVGMRYWEDLDEQEAKELRAEIERLNNP